MLLGMGGSSLAPGLFAQVLANPQRGLPLEVLDSTVPGAVLDALARLDLTRTLFIVSSKSGTTVETLSLFRTFYNRLAQARGPEAAGRHFVAITDPGTPLASLAEALHFRARFLNDPTVGGRYSALTYFGLVPAALVGADLEVLLARAQEALCGSEGCVPVASSLGARLGAVLGAAAADGRDKLTLLTSPLLSPFADWVEQLIAESTGKEGKGILPVVRETPGNVDVYRTDRLFVSLELADDAPTADNLPGLEAAGHPIVRLHLHDPYDIGGQIVHWEVATALAGHLLAINPFDQPNVESAKQRAREMVQAYREQGHLPEPEPALETAGLRLYGAVAGRDLTEALADFFADPPQGAYVALLAFLAPNLETEAALQRLRRHLRDRLHLATTLGFGPRYLHSTGQAHKGDAGRGLFLLLTADDPEDVPIPDEPGRPEASLTFGVLKTAQALGDQAALEAAGRRVLRVHLGQDPLSGLQRLLEAVP